MQSGCSQASREALPPPRMLQLPRSLPVHQGLTVLLLQAGQATCLTLEESVHSVLCIIPPLILTPAHQVWAFPTAQPMPFFPPTFCSPEMTQPDLVAPGPSARPPSARPRPAAGLPPAARSPVTEQSRAASPLGFVLQTRHSRAPASLSKHGPARRPHLYPADPFVSGGAQPVSAASPVCWQTTLTASLLLSPQSVSPRTITLSCREFGNIPNLSLLQVENYSLLCPCRFRSAICNQPRGSANYFLKA